MSIVFLQRVVQEFREKKDDQKSFKASTMTSSLTIPKARFSDYMKQRLIPRLGSEVSSIPNKYNSIIQNLFNDFDVNNNSKFLYSYIYESQTKTLIITSYGFLDENKNAITIKKYKYSKEAEYNNNWYCLFIIDQFGHILSHAFGPQDIMPEEQLKSALVQSFTLIYSSLPDNFQNALQLIGNN